MSAIDAGKKYFPVSVKNRDLYDALMAVYTILIFHMFYKFQRLLFFLVWILAMTGPIDLIRKKSYKLKQKLSNKSIASLNHVDFSCPKIPRSISTSSNMSRKESYTKDSNSAVYSRGRSRSLGARNRNSVAFDLYDENSPSTATSSSRNPNRRKSVQNTRQNGSNFSSHNFGFENFHNQQNLVSNEEESLRSISVPRPPSKQKLRYTSEISIRSNYKSSDTILHVQYEEKISKGKKNKIHSKYNGKFTDFNNPISKLDILFAILFHLFNIFITLFVYIPYKLFVKLKYSIMLILLIFLYLRYTNTSNVLLQNTFDS